MFFLHTQKVYGNNHALCHVADTTMVHSRYQGRSFCSGYKAVMGFLLQRISLGLIPGCHTRITYCTGYHATGIKCVAIAYYIIVIVLSKQSIKNCNPDVSLG